MLRRIFGSLFRRSQADRDLDEELQAHLAIDTQQRLEDGQRPEAARAAARRDFGNVLLVQEATRNAWGWTWIERLMQDVQYGARMLARNPGFTTAAVVSLALGIGANGALFSVVDAALLRHLPVQDADQLVVFKRLEADGRTPPDLPYPVFERLRNQPDAFTAVTANWPIERSETASTSGVDVGSVRVGMAAGNYFSTLQVPAAMGRTLTDDDNRSPGGHPVAVISHAYWQRRFGARGDAVGRTVHIAGTAFTVVGVAQRQFAGEWVGRPIDIWVPFMMASQVMPEVPGGPPRFPALLTARLKKGVALAQAQAAAQLRYQNALRDAAGGSLTAEQERGLAQRRITLEPAATGYSVQRAALAQPLQILALMAALGLLAVCASLANLLLARSEARERELAVRQALGAGRTRLVRQLLTEGALLAALGGLLGVGLVYWSTGSLAAWFAAGPLASGVEDHSLLLDIQVDSRVIVCGLLLSALVVLLFALAPALRVSRTSMTVALRERGASATGKAGRFGLARILVIAQVALTLVLMMGAGLMLRSLRNLQAQDVGFERERLLLVWAAPARAGRSVPELAGLAQRVHERVSALPGVTSASISSGGVLDGSVNGGRSETLKFEGQEPKPGLVMNSLAVSPDFFATVGMPIIRGRGIEPRDAGTAPVAVISETVARFFFAGQDPVGKRFGPTGEQGYPIEIIGVAKDAKLGTPRDQRGAWYFPYQQNPRFLRLNWCIAVRTSGSPTAASASVLQALREVDSSLAILRVNTIEEQLGHVLSRERLIAQLAAFFCLLAVLLTCVALYALVSLRVARRTNEIGIRLALGATASDVVRMVVGESLLLVSAGIAVGVPSAVALTRWLSTWLFGLERADAWTLIAAPSLMLVVAGMAALLPALKTRRIDPMTALRAD